MNHLREAAEMVVECFDNDYGHMAKQIALSDLRAALRDDTEELISTLERAVASLEWAAAVIKDIPPKSEFMLTIEDAKTLLKRIKE
jgi:hypothetical protein